MGFSRTVERRVMARIVMMARMKVAFIHDLEAVRPEGGGKLFFDGGLDAHGVPRIRCGGKFPFRAAFRICQFLLAHALEPIIDP